MLDKDNTFWYIQRMEARQMTFTQRVKIYFWCGVLYVFALVAWLLWIKP